MRASGMPQVWNRDPTSAIRCGIVSTKRPNFSVYSNTGQSYSGCGRSAAPMLHM